MARGLRCCARSPVCTIVWSFPRARRAGGACGGLCKLSSSNPRPITIPTAIRIFARSVVMAMANATLFATPPVLPPPLAAQFCHPIAVAEFGNVNSVCDAFQPRAPPIS